MSKLLPLLIFCGVLVLLLFLEKKSFYGLFLNKKITPFYNQIKNILQNIRGTRTFDNLVFFAMRSLKSDYNIYKKLPFNQNDYVPYCHDIFNNYSNDNIVYCWVVLFMYAYFKTHDLNKSAINKEFLDSKIKEVLTQKELYPKSFFEKLAPDLI